MWSILSLWLTICVIRICTYIYIYIYIYIMLCYAMQYHNMWYHIESCYSMLCYVLEWHYLSNATFLTRPHLFSTALLVNAANLIATLLAALEQDLRWTSSARQGVPPETCQRSSRAEKPPLYSQRADHTAARPRRLSCTIMFYAILYSNIQL